MEVFELYKKNLDEMMEIGKDKEYSIYTPEFYDTLSMYDYQKKRYIDKIDKYFLQVIEVKFNPLLSVKKNYSVIAPLDAD